MSERELEVVVWGATGFTGRLTAEVLSRVPDLRWGIAGRNRAKLEALRSELGATDLPILVGDSHDRASLDAITARSAVVLSTVGPFARFGSELVAACAAGGTHYADITGEPQWVRAMIDAHEPTAKETGARIVHCCGFDSIPSDLGCWALQQAAIERHGAPCKAVKTVVRGMKGGVSGGTAASLLDAVQAVRNDPAVRRVIGNPYALNPDGERKGPDRNDPLRPIRDPDFGWTAPFVMAGINTRIVRRTNALLGFPYGREFRYTEAVRTGEGPLAAARALGVSAGLAGFMTAAALGPTRSILKRFLPKSGQGPDAEARERGFFRLEMLGRGTSSDGRPFALRADVRGKRDPGYGATSRMLAAAGLTLARDPLQVGGGSWTPASALGPHLRTRLEAADVTFTISEA